MRAPVVPLLSALCCLAPALLRSADGVTGADVLSTRPSARATALGGAFAGLGDDLSALSYNPSALAKITGPSLGFLHFAEIDAVSLEDIAYAQNLSFGTLGAAVEYRGQPAIANPQATDSPVIAWDLVVTLAYAVKLNYWGLPLPDFLSQADGGIGVKYVQSHLGQVDAYTAAVDLGVHLPVGEGILLGASLLNLGPPMHFIDATNADPLPATVLIGVSRGFDPVFSNQINIAADVDEPFLDSTRLHFGVEDWINGGLAVRVGYLVESNNQSVNGLTGGFGVVLNQDGLVFHLDYAILPYFFSGPGNFSDFEMQQQFQMGLTF